MALAANKSDPCWRLFEHVDMLAGELICRRNHSYWRLFAGDLHFNRIFSVKSVPSRTLMTFPENVYVNQASMVKIELEISKAVSHHRN